MTIVLHASEKKCQTQTPYFFSWDKLPDLLLFLQDRQGTIYRLHKQTPIQNIQAGGFWLDELFLYWPRFGRNTKEERGFLDSNHDSITWSLFLSTCSISIKCHLPISRCFENLWSAFPLTVAWISILRREWKTPGILPPMPPSFPVVRWTIDTQSSLSVDNIRKLT